MAQPMSSNLSFGILALAPCLLFECQNGILRYASDGKHSVYAEAQNEFGFG